MHFRHCLWGPGKRDSPQHVITHDTGHLRTLRESGKGHFGLPFIVKTQRLGTGAFINEFLGDMEKGTIHWTEN